MAEHGDHGKTPAEMGEHLRTWKLFTSVIKWNIIGAAVIMLLLLMFRTNG